MVNKIKAVLLDIDGTLINSNDAHTKAWQEALSDYGFHKDYNSIRNKIGMGSDHLLPQLLSLKKNDPVVKLIDQRHGELFRSKYLPSLQAFKGSRELLSTLKNKGFKLIVVSSSSKKDLKELLKIDGLSNFFDNFNQADTERKSKPDPDIINDALKEESLNQDEALMIGDTPYDIEAAKRAGVKIMAFTTGGWNAQELKEADAIFSGPQQLLENLPDFIFA